MFRLSNILERYKPKEFLSSSDKRLYTMKCQDWGGAEFPRKEAKERWNDDRAEEDLAAAAVASRAAAPAREHLARATITWEGSYTYPIFKKIIDENIPCLIISTCENKWRSGVNIVVQFMTGNLDDVFLVHPEDLKLWNPDEELPHV